MGMTVEKVQKQGIYTGTMLNVVQFPHNYITLVVACVDMGGPH